MGTLYLVRHGQASFGQAHYDQLSELGARQCRRLGEHWAQRGLAFDAVFTGTLARHAQSLAALAAGLPGLPAPQALAGWNEYDADALVQARHPGPLTRGDSPDIRRHHFRLLREALLGWMHAELPVPGHTDFAGFATGVAQALAQARNCGAERVLVLSSGGPISVALGQVLGLAPEAIVELNMRLRNSAVCELGFNGKRCWLQTYNTLPHLEANGFDGWITHA